MILTKQEQEIINLYETPEDKARAREIIKQARQEND